MEKRERTFCYIDEEETVSGHGLSLVCLYEEDKNRKLASIQDLEWQIRGQQRLLDLGLSWYKDLRPCGEDSKVIVVFEGSYIWDKECKKYEKVS